MQRILSHGFRGFPVDCLFTIVLTMLFNLGCSESEGTGTEGLDADVTYELPSGSDGLIDVGFDSYEETPQVSYDLVDESVEDEPCLAADDAPDSDGDGVPDECDRCDDADDNADDDQDGVPDACDLCPIGDDNNDSDEDGTPDSCDCGEQGDACHELAFCVPNDDGFDCQCLLGFQGDGFNVCNDIDECLGGRCATDAECHNNFGGFTCACSTGFIGQPYSAACEECTACTGGLSYETQACQGTTDRVCSDCTTCTETQYETVACSGTTDRSCAECTACAETQYALSDCAATADQVCANCTTCSGTQYQVSDCTDVADRVCADCTACSGTQFQVSDCSASANRVCDDCAVCSGSQYQVSDCSASADRICHNCDESCATCDDAGPTGCTTCAEEYYDADTGVDHNCLPFRTPIVFESATGDTCSGYWPVTSRFWPGWRFEVPEGTRFAVDTLGYYGRSGTGTLFFAVAELDPASRTPEPIDLTGDDVVALVVRDWPSEEGEVTVEVDVEIGEGTYGIWVGTSMHGADGSGSGACAGMDVVAGTEATYTLDVTSDSWSSASGARYFVAGETIGAVCGNGILEPTEACDDGDDNGTDVGDCNPACSGLID